MQKKRKLLNYYEGFMFFLFKFKIFRLSDVE